MNDHTLTLPESSSRYTSLLFLQEDVIQKCSHGDIKVTLLQLEVERIRFVVASYLRTRVHKVGLE